MATIGSLVVRVGADISSLESELKKAERAVAASAKRIRALAEEIPVAVNGMRSNFRASVKPMVASRGGGGDPDFGGRLLSLFKDFVPQIAAMLVFRPVRCTLRPDCNR